MRVVTELKQVHEEEISRLQKERVSNTGPGRRRVYVFAGLKAEIVCDQWETAGGRRAKEFWDALKDRWDRKVGENPLNYASR